MNSDTESKLTKKNECKNFNNQFKGLYCNNCGQKVIHKRNTLKHLSKLIFDSFDVDKGLFFTVKLLFVNPGKLINEYLNGRTKDYFNPLKYLLLVAGLSAVFIIGFGIYDINV